MRISTVILPFHLTESCWYNAAMNGKYPGLYIMPSSGGKSLPLAVTANSHNEGAIWSPNGKKIALTVQGQGVMISG